MEIWNWVLPVAVGALIGYCTNYIAIKMLFRPRKAVQIRGWTLPFTPGVIPKNQPRIARAVGRAVGESLLTREDLAEAIRNEEIRRKVCGGAADAVMRSEASLGDLVRQAGEEKGRELMEKASDAVTGRIIEGIRRLDIQKLVRELAVPAIMDKIQGTMLAMFVNEELVQSMTGPIGEDIEQYLEWNGPELIGPIVKEELEGLLERTPGDLLQKVDVDREMLETVISRAYEKLMEEKAERLLQNLNIPELVEKKVKEMDMMQLEELIMSVMKQELQAVINLGAVIGAVIGVLNIFI